NTPPNTVPTGLVSRGIMTALSARCGSVGNCCIQLSIQTAGVIAAEKPQHPGNCEPRGPRRGGRNQAYFASFGCPLKRAAGRKSVAAGGFALERSECWVNCRKSAGSAIAGLWGAKYSYKGEVEDVGKG